MAAGDSSTEATGSPPEHNRRGPRLISRIGSRITRPFLADTHRRVGELHESVHDLRQDLHRIQHDLDRAHAMVRLVFDEEPANRRRLQALRESADYELAFTESEPLVSFLVPTYRNQSGLRDVSLPSILNQTYSNLEVIVVGDSAPPETAEVIAELGDPRVRYSNRTVRGPYPDDDTRWYVVGTPPYNEALSLARGRWIASLGDDDAVRPGHTETLVAAAQAELFEHCYGRQMMRFSRGEDFELGEFPPQLGKWGPQTAIYHAGLRFFELELADALYREPNDWSLCRRMLRAGVRFGMVDEVVVDKYEMRRSAEEWKRGLIPRIE